MTALTKGAEIQSRDAEIMQFVFAHRVVTPDQIRRKFFTNQHRTAATRRLRKLYESEYLGDMAILRNGRPERCFTPTAKGTRHTRNLWKFEIDNPLFKSESPEHDVRLAELFLKLEKLQSFRSFYSENVLQSSSVLAEDPVLSDFVKMQSDGALVLANKGGTQSVFALELEITPKSLTRYKDKLASYYLSECVDGILYVCSSQSIAKLLAEADAAVRSHHKSILHYVMEGDALGKDQQIIFASSNLRKIVLA